VLIIRIPEEKMRGVECIFEEITTDNVPNFAKDTKQQFQK